MIYVACHVEDEFAYFWIYNFLCVVCVASLLKLHEFLLGLGPVSYSLFEKCFTDALIK